MVDGLGGSSAATVTITIAGKDDEPAAVNDAVEKLQSLGTDVGWGDDLGADEDHIVVGVDGVQPGGLDPAAAHAVVGVERSGAGQRAARQSMLEDFTAHADDRTEGSIRPQKVLWDVRQALGEAFQLRHDRCRAAAAMAPPPSKPVKTCCPFLPMTMAVPVSWHMGSTPPAAMHAFCRSSVATKRSLAEASGSSRMLLSCWRWPGRR